MASVSRQIGWSQESNLLYQILNQITKLTAVVFALKPKYKVFTALVSQTGGDSPSDNNSGILDVGVTYKINFDSVGMDFINVGAPNNNVGTYFIATGTTPNSWGIEEGLEPILTNNAGAPVAIVLENTIGNIWFEYVGPGDYTVNSNNLFIEDKTAVDIDAFSYLNIGNYSFIANSTLFPENTFNILSTLGDDVLAKNRLEIKVYN